MPKTNYVYLVADGISDFPHDLLRIGQVIPFRDRDVERMDRRLGMGRLCFRRFETIPLTRAAIVRNTIQLAPTFESYGWRIVGVYTAPDVAIAVTDFPEGAGKRRTTA